MAFLKRFCFMFHVLICSFPHTTLKWETCTPPFFFTKKRLSLIIAVKSFIELHQPTNLKCLSISKVCKVIYNRCLLVSYSVTHIFQECEGFKFPGKILQVFTPVHIQPFPHAALTAPVGGWAPPPLTRLFADHPCHCPRPFVHPFLGLGGFGGACGSSVRDDHDGYICGDVTLGGGHHTLPHPWVFLGQMLQHQGVNHGWLVWGLLRDDEDPHTAIGRYDLATT